MGLGYHGRILLVDLATGTSKVEVPDDKFYRHCNGNGVMGACFLLRLTKAGVHPYAPENPLMFLSGALNGHEAPGLARYTVMGKSPLTGGIGEARCEGPFAVALKKSGYDGIVIQGRCREPSALFVEDGAVTLRPVQKLWGRKVSETMDWLEAIDAESSCAVIGPAGEKQVRFATIVSDRCHQAARAGLGAVMGSKRLKAVVLRGGTLPAVADPARLEAISRDFEKKMHGNALSMWQKERPGFGVWIHTHGIDASVCVNNYRTATCDYLDRFKPEGFDPYYRGVAGCPACPNDCIKRYALRESDAAAGGLHQEILGAFGPNVGNDSVETLLRVNVLCNEYGMDPDSLGYTVSFAQEAATEGLLDPQGLDLSFSPGSDALRLAEMIAKREALGDLLAEGSAAAAKSLGAGAQRFALTVKGCEMVPFEPRTQTNLALGYAVGPTGPRYEICEHDWDFDTRVGWDHTLDQCRTLGILDRIPMEYLGRDKVRNFKALNTLWSAVDALGVCIFAAAPTRVLSLNTITDMLSAVTGWKTSAWEVMRLGELRNHLFRLYNCREGLGPEQDMLPDRFFTEPVDSGAHSGVVLDRAEFEDCVQTYYCMMGWDRNGVPTEGTLLDYGIDIASSA